MGFNRRKMEADRKARATNHAGNTQVEIALFRDAVPVDDCSKLNRQQFCPRRACD